ncbi:MAG TPA: SMI1/KNR4 family protein [Candidatus Angelobacter sp.]|nr:SMI1/KNR4 family protein [Candidatus Angelobacter sp.]
MPLHEIDNYFRNYDKSSYEVFSQQGAEPSMADVTAFESRIGFRLPAEFREFAVHPLGGLYMAVKEELWPRTRAYDIGPFWSFLYGLTIYALSPQAPDWLQMTNAWCRMSDNGSPQLVPFLKIIGDPDPYCFTPDQKIVIWRHENPAEVEEVAKGFSEVLMFEIRELEQRKERRVKGEPIM